jgi:hypothetical protein
MLFLVYVYRSCKSGVLESCHCCEVTAETIHRWSLQVQGHVNNVTYVRYAESARINWAYNYALHVDPENKDRWCELWTPRGDGLILRSMRTDYKFVRLQQNTQMQDFPLKRQYADENSL